MPQQAGNRTHTSAWNTLHEAGKAGCVCVCRRHVYVCVCITLPQDTKVGTTSKFRLYFVFRLINFEKTILDQVCCGAGQQGLGVRDLSHDSQLPVVLSKLYAKQGISHKHPESSGETTVFMDPHTAAT